MSKTKPTPGFDEMATQKLMASVKSVSVQPFTGAGYTTVLPVNDKRWSITFSAPIQNQDDAFLVRPVGYGYPGIAFAIVVNLLAGPLTLSRTEIGDLVTQEWEMASRQNASTTIIIESQLT